MKCKNCDHIFEGNFCSHCGQNSSVKRISLSNFLSEFSESVFQINRGFFFTIRELSVRPGYSLKEYLSGKRQQHYKPLAYVLIMSTFYFLISQCMSQDTMLGDMITSFVQGFNDQNTGIQLPIQTWLIKNYAYSTLLLLPIFSLASFLSFRKQKINLAEHLVINSYITGQQAIYYTIITIVLNFIESNILELFLIALATSYTGWVYSQLFKGETLAGNILRTILTYILYFTFVSILTFGTLTIYDF